MGRLWKFKISEVDEWVREGGAARDTLGVADEPGGVGFGSKGK